MVLHWVKAGRPLAQANIAAPILVGEAFAYSLKGQMVWGAFWLLHAYGIANHLFIVFANDVADEATDRQNLTFTPFSGGSRVLVDGQISRLALARAAWGMLAAMFAVGGWLAIAYSVPWVFGFVALAAALLWAYSFAPIRASYRGYGEILQGVGIGAVLPALGFYVQSGSFKGLPLSVILASALLGYAGNITTSLPDEPSDRQCVKRSFAVRVGPRGARQVSVVCVALAAIATPLLVRSSLAWGVCVAALLILSANLPYFFRAPKSYVRFVVVNGGAITLLFLGWSALAIASHGSRGAKQRPVVAAPLGALSSKRDEG